MGGESGEKALETILFLLTVMVDVLLLNNVLLNISGTQTMQPMGFLGLTCPSALVNERVHERVRARELIHTASLCSAGELPHVRIHTCGCVFIGVLMAAVV